MITSTILKKFDDYLAVFINIDKADSDAISAFWTDLDLDLNQCSPSERKNFMQQFMQSLKETHQNVAAMKTFVFHQ